MKDKINLSFPFIVDYIPISQNRRPGIKANMQYLTIHSTGNARSTAKNERGWLVNPQNTRTASWHIVVDEREAILAVPLDEVAYHAGDANGNRTSIGIEICESGNRQKTMENAIELTAELLKQYKWKTDKLKRHYDWSRKLCPSILMANNWALWHQFIREVDRKMSVDNKPLPQIQRRVNVIFRGQPLDLDGYLIKGNTQVPVRFIAQELGANVRWDGATSTVYID